MQEIIDKIVDMLQYSGIYGALIGCLIIFVESIFPVLPLAAFITINFIVFGKILGFILSWIFTVLGCIMSYMIFKYGFGKVFAKLTEDKAKLKKYSDLFKNISFGSLVVLIAVPFTPAFVVNIAAGLTKYDFKKYVIALIIGKISLIYFWGFVGTSLLESFSNPKVLINVGLVVLVMYLVSIILNKVLKLK